MTCIHLIIIKLGIISHFSHQIFIYFCSIRQYFLSLAPPYRPHLHNDLDYRVGPSDWPGGDEAWRTFRRTQPVNTHSHLIAMMLGTSESIPISDGVMKKGKYQSIMVVDVDGPKSRGLAVQITGGK